MVAAMMLPSVAPMALVFARVSGQRRGGDGFLPTCVFLCGYLVAWTAYGLAAYGVYSGVRSADWGFLAWERQGPVAAGAAVGIAGIYELTPFKRACLRHCRSPAHVLLHSWRPGRLGALRMGLEHGVGSPPTRAASRCCATRGRWRWRRRAGQIPQRSRRPAILWRQCLPA